ncbi:CBO0543 family protein [Evansella tamaricis]|uniref:Uncharacterized protein n=1 Tax=Evansella tamaricis TaxID=2069301 RepID=A0ABS6JAW4_9BACI|nr:CBO0543 family protein [Evansella tamaricis]MBU9710681.1 hypothetical protein [Evansella tamaricis]
MAYEKEKTVLISSWIISVVLLILFVPKNKIRNAHVAFLFKQAITWLFGLIVVEKGLITYPIRFFKKANKASFTFEYFVYPTLCTLFNIHYPEKKSNLIKLLFYFFHTSLIVVFEYYAVKKTRLITYPKWRWYWSFITIWGTYYISRIYYRWFFRDSINHEGEMSG